MSRTDSIAVVDVETTGLGGTDRIVEFAAVILDASSLTVIDEFDTLVNPRRDVGPTRIHGITASMVSAAPTFEEIAGQLASLLSGSIVVAHNLPFDLRFIGGEMSDAGAAATWGEGICTLKLTRQNLASACQSAEIELDDAHRALADARACAALLRFLALDGGILKGAPAEITAPGSASVPRTLRRDQVGGTSLPMQIPPLRFAFPGSDDASLSYLHMLNRYLADGHLSDDEKSDLVRLAEFNALTADIPKLHQRYLTAAIEAAAGDGIVNATELTYLTNLAACLELPLDVSDLPTADESAKASPTAGDRVCFTGQVVIDGELWERTRLVSLALKNGLVPVDSVTKKGCHYLVCADPSSGSGKAKKARDYGIPLMGATEFIRDFS